MVSQPEGLAFKAFERQFLRQQHIPLDESALGTEAQLLYALPVIAKLLDIERASVPDNIMSTCIAAGDLEVSQCIELFKLRRGEMGPQ